MLRISIRALVALSFFGIVISCGGGSGGSSSGGTSGPNELNVLVGTGTICDNNPPGSYVNEPCTSVTICSTGTSTCQTISDVLVDTGSYGLRLFRSAISGVTPSPETNGSDTVGECAFFGSASTWGQVEKVDVVLGGEPAVTVPIQVIDPTYAGQYTSSGADPSSGGNVCGKAQVEYSPLSSEYNGILGVGLFIQDNQQYESCSTTTCNSLVVSSQNQVQNPVAALAVDNNGVLLTLPSVPSTGSSSVTGTLVLGIGTESDNSLPSGMLAFPADGSGEMTGTFSGTPYPAFLDSGSNGIFFYSSITQCSTWYCPASTANLSVTFTGYGGNPAETVPFSIQNANNLFATGNSAFDDLGAYASGSFDMGLSWFFGRTIGVGINGTGSGLGTGPYFAF